MTTINCYIFPIDGSARVERVHTEYSAPLNSDVIYNSTKYTVTEILPLFRNDGSVFVDFYCKIKK